MLPDKWLQSNQHCGVWFLHRYRSQKCFTGYFLTVRDQSSRSSERRNRQSRWCPYVTRWNLSTQVASIPCEAFFPTPSVLRDTCDNSFASIFCCLITPDCHYSSLFCAEKRKRAKTQKLIVDCHGDLNLCSDPVKSMRDVIVENRSNWKQMLGRRIISDGSVSQN